MYSICFVKNIDTIEHVWQGMTLQPDDEYQIQDIERESWASNDDVLQAITNDLLQVGTGTEWITGGYSEQINWLKGGVLNTNVSNFVFDLEGRPMFRPVATQSEYHYTPRSLDFYTAKYSSLYNCTHYGDGTIDGAPDIGDAWLKFFDSDNDELIKGESETDEEFQTRLTSDCTKTVLYFEPHFDYDVFGAKVQFRDIPSDRAYFWFVVAPDIPAEYGGNVVFMGGGMNISFFNERDTFECDGKTTSKIYYDPTYHSGVAALMIKHNAGVQIGIQLIYQFYSSSGS